MFYLEKSEKYTIIYLYGEVPSNYATKLLHLVTYNNFNRILRAAITAIMAAFIISLLNLITPFHRFLSKIRVWVEVKGTTLDIF